MLSKKNNSIEICWFIILVERQEEQSLRKIVGISCLLACDGGEEEEKQIRARVVGGWGENAKKRARARSGREKRVGDNESVRASLAKRSERSRSRHFWPVRLQVAGRALSWRSVRLSEASKKKGDYSICVWASCVCILAHDPRNWRSVLLPAESPSVTLHLIPRGDFTWSDWFEDKKTREIKGFCSDPGTSPSS